MPKEIDPRMHSAEHILNQTMDRMFSCGRCFNAHIEKKKAKCDYHFDHPLTQQEVDEIQSCINQVINDDLKVYETHVSIAEAMASYNTDKLPENAGQTIRIVHIGDYDSVPCIGEHVKSTGEVPHFRLSSHTFDNGVLRIRYKLQPIEDH